MDRTRQLKPAPELVWEKPEERFRVAMEDVERGISALASAGYVSATTTVGANPARDGRAAAGALAVFSDGEESRAGSVPSDVGTDITLNEDNGSAETSVLSTPIPALDQARHSHDHQQRVAVAASSLTVSVWIKSSAMGGLQDLLLGRATVPTRYIDHPPGDVWLPLAGVSNPTSASATATSGGEENQKGVAGPAAGHEDGDSPALGAVSESPYTGAIAGDANGAGSKKRGGKKSWGSGLLFKRKGPRKGDGATGLGQPQAMAAGSVRVWLGKVRRGSLSGQQPGNGHAILRVHGASALRKVQFVVAFK